MDTLTCRSRTMAAGQRSHQGCGLLARQGALPTPRHSARTPVLRQAAYYESELPVSGLKTKTIGRAPKPSDRSSLMYKLQLCFKIFFPDDEPKANVTPKEEVKRRLKMVLVADRCGMSPNSLGELKKTIARALQDFVELESEDAIEVNISDDPGLGTVYCVAIPVRRVKAESRFAEGRLDSGPDGVVLEWDPTDLHSDPSGRFPQGC